MLVVMMEAMVMEAVTRAVVTGGTMAGGSEAGVVMAETAAADSEADSAEREVPMVKVRMEAGQAGATHRHTRAYQCSKYQRGIPAGSV